MKVTAPNTVIASLALGALALLGTTAAHAQYQYGGQYGGGDKSGFVVLVESSMANPRNTDAVVAITESPLGGTTSVLPDWDDEFAGTFGVGYQWPSGNKLMVSLWGFEADQQATGGAAAGGTTHFTIGPPIADGSGGYVGNRGMPGTFDIKTELDARTLDIAFSRQFEAGDGFEIEWSVGLRVATFEETQSGTYGDALGFDPGAGPIVVFKKNETDMLGLRGAVGATYRLSGSLALRASMGLSMLDGEVTAQSGLTAGGTVGSAAVGPSSSQVEDDGRSGTIRELDAALVWTAPIDGLSIWLGWGQSEWEEIAADLMRNFPGSTALLRERDSATFSAYKLGISYNF
jgi:hypothetical protein